VTDVRHLRTGSYEHGCVTDDARQAELVKLIRSEAPKVWGPGSSDAIGRIDAAHDDLCAAMLRCVDRASNDATTIVEGLIAYWTITGRRSTGREWCRRVADTATDPARRIQFALYDGQLARDDGDPAAAGAVEALVAAARELHDPATVALGLTILAPTVFRTGHIAEAKQMASEALTLLRRGGRPRYVVEALNILGNAATVEGDAPAAFALYEDALAVSREAGMNEIIPKILVNLGSLSVGRANYGRAREYYTEAQELARTVGDAIVASAALTNLGVIATAERDYRRARTLLDEALDLKREMKDARGTAIVLHGLADLDRAQGHDAASRRRIHESLAISRDIDFSIGMISGLETAAALLAETADAPTGLRVAAAAEAARDSTGQRRSVEDASEFERVVAGLRATVGIDAQTQWNAGLALELTEAVTAVLGLLVAARDRP
jgi:tetratricopeptide (TPR) repeat protein